MVPPPPPSPPLPLLSSTCDKERQLADGGGGGGGGVGEEPIHTTAESLVRYKSFSAGYSLGIAKVEHMIEYRYLCIGEYGTRSILFRTVSPAEFIPSVCLIFPSRRRIEKWGQDWT
jgi:hypothetical protein